VVALASSAVRFADLVLDGTLADAQAER